MCREWLAEDKARAIAAEKARIEEEEANMLVGPELPAGVTLQDMGDYGGALLPGRLSVSSGNLYCVCKQAEMHSLSMSSAYLMFALC